MFRTIKIDSFSILQVIGRWRLLKPIRLESAENLREFFLEVCGAMSIKNLLEIGAHEASVSIDFLLGESTFARRALAFEANPFTFDSKTRLAGDSGVEVYNIGVADSASFLDFQIPVNKDDVANSLAPGNASFLVRNDSSVFYEIVEVPTITLNEIFNTHNILGNSALWIDVEGFSKPVLLGADHALSSANAQIVFIEIETASFWKEQSSLPEVFSLLSKYGYKWVARDFEYKEQSNYLFIKNDSVPLISSHIRKHNLKSYKLIFKSFILFPITFFQHLLEKF
jgi:FkbM family methyltransferase